MKLKHGDIVISDCGELEYLEGTVSTFDFVDTWAAKSREFFMYLNIERTILCLNRYGVVGETCRYIVLRTCTFVTRMGNANGREEGSENGGDEVSEGSNHAPAGRVASADLMVSSPPRDPLQSRAPLSFSSQAPVVPLQRNDGSSLNSLRPNEAQRAVDRPHEQGIPTIVTWSFGGNNVAVEGCWDNWRTRKILQRSGKDHSILLVLPSGIFRYRFIVDGEVRYIPDLPIETDEMGRVCNLLDVHDYVPENLDSVAEFEAPQSPESSYSQVFPGDEDFAKDPMMVPPQLTSSVLSSESQKETAASSKPQHVVLNHVFMEKERSSQSVVALGLTHRFQSKYVTVVLYKPLKG
ncbi:5'-AMP-activated protein kinase beta-2 subunit protein [Perilla frutescens var. hirtella]|uniref:5'-AMP-activated protein kinase beta-2 subunit protein n=1 Tax=Perilla frutescens var. hirtella TaxID=608512 RepID=A0AAD4JNB0_PERFH|nr:5'-AMP-activated protein kinase beta-2 subunit protein [Perilla frutescens var. hirtella]